MLDVQLEEVLDNLYDGVYYVDKDKKILFWNKAAEKITGYTQAEVLNHSCSDNILKHIDQDGHELCLTKCPLSTTLSSGNSLQDQVYLHHKDGHRVAVSVRVTPIKNAQGEITGALEIFSDNTQYQNTLLEMEKLKQDIYLDPLTQVGNRKYCDMVIQTKLFDYNNFHLNFGAIFFDIDNFKKFNDTYGHPTGDAILKAVSQSIRNLLRSADVICRYGGEEFVAIVMLPEPSYLKLITERVRLFVEQSFIMTSDQKQIHVTVSVGATTSQEEDTMESLISRADQLMYQSKTTGKNKVTLG